MADIAKWLNEAHQNKMANLVVEDTLSDLKRRDATVLDPYVPFKTYNSRQFLAYVMEQMNVIASVTAYGAEPPVTNQGGFRKITAELMKSTLAYVWDEEYQWHMAEAMAEAQAKNITVQQSRDSAGKLRSGSNMDLAGFIFGTVEKLARAQVELLNHMSWQVLQFGEVDREDPRTGVLTKLDYKYTLGGYNHFPAAKAGDGRWTQWTTANGLQDLYNAVDTYVDTNGFGPDCIYMSRKALNNLMQQQSTKDAASSLTVAQVGTVSPGMLGALLEARGIPSIKTFDERYRNEMGDQSVANSRFLQDNRYVFVKENMGERAMGPTLENDRKSGVYVVTYEKQKVPPVDVTQAVATILPVFADPKLFYSQQISDPT